MKVAILGYSQSGKKTLFTLLTGRHIPAGRQEHEVVDGNAPVRDPRVDEIAKIAKPEKIKYAETAFMLCPDIVDGGVRSTWLEAAKKSDMLCLVVRSFTSDTVYHPAGSVDTARDRSSLHSEILLADLELVEKRLERMAKEKRGGQTPAQVTEERTLEKCKQAIEAEQYLSGVKLEEHEMASIRSLGLLTLKPVLWAYNVDESGIDAKSVNPFYISCKIEEEISGIKDPAERKEFLAAIGLDTPGVDRMNAAVYDMLGLMSFYTMGEDEVRAWTIKKGTAAPQAGGKIHTDIERGFIRVEVIKYDDLMSLGSESAAKQKGKCEQKGRDYVMQDGDICHFLHNV